MARLDVGKSKLSDGSELASKTRELDGHMRRFAKKISGF